MDCYKILAICGLLLDVIGVFILLNSELNSKEIAYLKEEGYNKKNPFDWDVIMGRKEESPTPVETERAKKIEGDDYLRKSFNSSKIGLMFLGIGFLLQIVAIIVS